MKEPAISVEGFRYADSHITWELVRQDYEVISCAQLLQKFRKEWRWFIKKPMAWARDPVDRTGEPMFSVNLEVIVAAYPKNFHIVIERTDMFGPHPARLYYRSTQVDNEIAWVAICQVEGMWHSDDRMLKGLNHAIRNKELFQSQKSAELIVIK